MGLCENGKVEAALKLQADGRQRVWNKFKDV